MSYGLNIRKDAELDFLALGALIHRLDPGIIPFRKATECKIHVSGQSFRLFSYENGAGFGHGGLSHRRPDR